MHYTKNRSIYLRVRVCAHLCLCVYVAFYTHNEKKYKQLNCEKFGSFETDANSHLQISIMLH